MEGIGEESILLSLLSSHSEHCESAHFISGQKRMLHSLVWKRTGMIKARNHQMEAEGIPRISKQAVHGGEKQYVGKETGAQGSPIPYRSKRMAQMERLQLTLF